MTYSTVTLKVLFVLIHTAKKKNTSLKQIIEDYKEHFPVMVPCNVFKCFYMILPLIAIGEQIKLHFYWYN